MFCISSGGGQMGMHICKNLSSCTLKICYFTVCHDISKVFKNDSRPSLAHIFCGMYMIPIDKCPDLAASHVTPYVISGANI